MKVSIAIATYNGSTHLQEQLSSILEQSVLPDEVIICDDSSSDDTISYISSFTQQAPFKVDLHLNPIRLGYAKNFEKSISKCTGNIIFLCDQDDVWHSNKIERILEEFNRNSNTILIIHDAEIILADGSKTNLTVSGQLKSQGLDTDDLLLGCCMAFRATLKPLIIPIPHLIHGHDGWINILGKSLNRRKFIPITLQSYRRHSTNTSTQRFTSTRKVGALHALKDKLSWRSLGSSPTKASNKRLEQATILLDHLESLQEEIVDNILSKQELLSTISQIKSVKENYEIRLRIQKLAPFKRIIPCIRFYFAGGYKKHEGLLSLVRDIFSR